VRHSIDEFVRTNKASEVQPYVNGKIAAAPVPPPMQAITSQPIPGFTGFIPGRRVMFASSFGTSSKTAYDDFNHRNEQYIIN
jgi:hypothetical protein